MKPVSRPVLQQMNVKVKPFVLVLFMVLIPGIVASQSDDHILPIPDVSLQPGDIVKIVLDALANNDYPFPDAGIETTFNFASPANKSNTGPLERFAQMVKGPVFRTMLGHESYEVSEVVMNENRAYQLIRLITANGTEVHFAFRLGLQIEGEYKGMWMTEAVWPVESIVQGLDV